MDIDKHPFPSHQGLAILDFGSQYSQLIARRVREGGVFSELFYWNTPADEVMAHRPKGFILSGGPASVYEEGAPYLPGYILDSGLPVLGICYGMGLLAHYLGGRVAPALEREYGLAFIELAESPAPFIPYAKFPDKMQVWMSHGDRIDLLPPGFAALASSDNSPNAAMGNISRKLYGVQFHPEVVHTPQGAEILKNFAVDICGCRPDWTAGNFINEAVTSIREQVGDSSMVLGLSGGVDSSVVAALAHRALGDRLVCIFVDTGMMRQGEPEQVIQTFQREMNVRLIAVNAVEEYLETLSGVTDPEKKRKLIGERFVRIFEREARKLGDPRKLAMGQGTIYPDVIESAAKDRPGAHKIKSHHNVGGLPENIEFKTIVEPLRWLFKDEVRKVGKELGLPDEIIWRQPFPGPGLGIRILGEITWDGLQKLRKADAIFREELSKQDGLRTTAQAFAVLLPVRSVGVMGDARTYEQPVVLRAVQTDDFMTADWARLDWDLLARISRRIVNEVDGINRVVYDITSKPPATIEWE